MNKNKKRQVEREYREVQAHIDLGQIPIIPGLDWPPVVYTLNKGWVGGDLLYCYPSVKFVGEHWQEVKDNSPDDLVVIPPHPETVQCVYCFATKEDALDFYGVCGSR